METGGQDRKGQGEALALAERLCEERSLTVREYERLIAGRTPALASLLAARARALCDEVYGDAVYVRGLIEVSNYCANDCRYCGIRRGNKSARRYRLSEEEILACAEEGYALGCRTFVLQGGEDPSMADGWVAAVVRDLKVAHPDCAVTLSLGERDRESYALWREAGADRYLLRHETADPGHYRLLHPSAMDWGRRRECLRDLKELGYGVGVGFMVGSPFQTAGHLAADLKFVEDFQPAMVGIGPFVPHQDTPFGSFPPGTVELTCFLLSVLRLIKPNLLLPSTTALATIDPEGRERGIQAGANVVMPNLSPPSARERYQLYDGKVCARETAVESQRDLGRRLARIGYRFAVDRGEPASRE